MWKIRAPLLAILLSGCAFSPRTAPVDLLRLAAPEAGESGEGTLSLTFFETGIGDAFLIELPAGKTLLIDAGIGWDVGQILDYLRARGIARLDGLLLTHPHADHFGGMERIVREVPVGTFYHNGVPSSSASYGRMMLALEERGVPIRVLRRGDRLEDFASPPPSAAELALPGASPPVSLEVLYPDDAAVALGGGKNRSTLALRLVHGSLRFLLLGDCEWPEESRLLALEGDGLRADVLKLGHHGSPRSGGLEFLQAVRPRIAVAQGTSLLNMPLFYPRPNYRIRRALENSGALLLTDRRDGVIRLVSDGQVLSVRTSRAARPAPAVRSDLTRAALDLHRHALEG